MPKVSLFQSSSRRGSSPVCRSMGSWTTSWCSTWAGSSKASSLSLRKSRARRGDPHVFSRVLTLALEMAEEGWEGQPMGTLFVLGDHEKVMGLSSQIVIIPFGGFPEAERNGMDAVLKETTREFSAMDGAFIVRHDGVIMTVGQHLKASAKDEELPSGLGARHRAAAGITAMTSAVAFVMSEFNGDLRLFRNGKLFYEERERGEGETNGPDSNIGVRRRSIHSSRSD